MISRVPLLLTLALCLAACAGGGGALQGPIDTQDAPPLSNEGAATTTEGIRSSSEAVGSSNEGAERTGTESSPTGGGGTGGFDCAGTYSCGIGSRQAALNLVSDGAGCSVVERDGDVEATLDPNGTITNKGRVIATWTRTANGFSYSAQDDGKTVTITCTKGAPVAGDDDDDDGG